MSESRKTRKSIWRLLWPILMVATWLGSMIWVGAQIGADGVVIGLIVAGLLAVPIVGVYVWFGRWSGGVPSRLVSAFAWGASIAAFCAIWSEAWLQDLVDATLGKDVGTWVRPLLITPVMEEGFKGLFLVWLLCSRRRQITGLLDGIVFGGVVGAGFAFTENTLYLGRAIRTFVESDSQDSKVVGVLVATLFFRMLLVPFFHPLLVSLFGLGIAASANGRISWVRVTLPIVGIIVAMTLHGIWDWAGLAGSDPLLNFKIYGAVLLPLFIAAMSLAFVLRHRRGRTIAATLPTLAEAEAVATEEVDALSNLGERRRWRRDARRRGGRAGARATGRFQAEVSALAVRTARARTTGHDALVEEQVWATADARHDMLETV